MDLENDDQSNNFELENGSDSKDDKKRTPEKQEAFLVADEKESNLDERERIHPTVFMQENPKRIDGPNLSIREEDKGKPSEVDTYIESEKNEETPCYTQVGKLMGDNQQISFKMETKEGGIVFLCFMILVKIMIEIGLCTYLAHKYPKMILDFFRKIMAVANQEVIEGGKDSTATPQKEISDALEKQCNYFLRKLQEKDYREPTAEEKAKLQRAVAGLLSLIQDPNTSKDSLEEVKDSITLERLNHADYFLNCLIVFDGIQLDERYAIKDFEIRMVAKEIGAALLESSEDERRDLLEKLC